MMLSGFMINSHIQNNCCKHHIIAPTGFEPIKLFAVKNTDMFRRFSTTDKLGQWQGVESNHQHVPCNGIRIAVEVTNMTYNLFYCSTQLSYLAILPPITVNHPDSK